MQVSMNDYNKILNIVLRPECIESLLDDKITPAELVKSIFECLQVQGAFHFIEDGKLYIRVIPFIGNSGIVFVAATKEFRGKKLIDYMRMNLPSLKAAGINKLISFVRSDNKAAMMCNSSIGMKRLGELTNNVSKNGNLLNHVIYEMGV